jgi:hypothetical protein
LTDSERALAKLAAAVISWHGGVMTFAQYDEAMYKIMYFAPLNWVYGWGNSTLHKMNNDKLCVFAACAMNLVTQRGFVYRIVE